MYAGLQRSFRVSVRSLGRPSTSCKYSTPTALRTASVLVNAATPSPSSSLSERQLAAVEEARILKPISRKTKIESLSRAEGHHESTTIFFDGEEDIKPITVPNFYLRDSSIHSSHVHPASQQRLFRSSDIPSRNNLIGMGVHIIEGEECLVMEWDTPLQSVELKAACLSVIKVDTLVRLSAGAYPAFSIPQNAIKQKVNKTASSVNPQIELWNKKRLASTEFRVHYKEYQTSTSSLRRIIDTLINYGLVIVTNVPFHEKEGVNTELRNVVERIGSIRRTWYGDLWDVKAEENSKNIAYTNLDLGLHMDLTHFESPPRYQFLHCLQNSHVKGGESYFVDSFHVANQLRHLNEKYYTVLSETPISFEYNNGGYHTRWVRPTLEHRSGPEGAHALWAVNYSPPFQGPLPNPTDQDSSTAFQELGSALKAFADLCDDPSNQYRCQLLPGDCVIFDNRRVLHARTAFEFIETTGGKEVVGEKGRWLKGAYMDGDEVWSRWRVLEADREKGKLN